MQSLRAGAKLFLRSALIAVIIALVGLGLLFVYSSYISAQTYLQYPAPPQPTPFTQPTATPTP
jgi:hypothetical protein